MIHAPLLQTNRNPSRVRLHFAMIHYGLYHLFETSPFFPVQTFRAAVGWSQTLVVVCDLRN